MTMYNTIIDYSYEHVLMAITPIIAINNIKFNIPHMLTLLNGTILYNAFKTIKTALPIGMLLWNTQVILNIKGRATFLLN